MAEIDPQTEDALERLKHAVAGSNQQFGAFFDSCQQFMVTAGGNDIVISDGRHDIEGRLRQGLFGIVESQVESRLLRQDKRTECNIPMRLPGGQQTYRVNTPLRQTPERQCIKHLIELSHHSAHRFGGIIVPEQSQFAFQRHPFIRRIFQVILVERAPPEQSAQIMGPTGKQRTVEVSARPRLTADHRTETADFLRQARFAAAEVTVQARFDGGMKRVAKRVERFPVAMRRE